MRILLIGMNEQSHAFLEYAIRRNDLKVVAVIWQADNKEIYELLNIHNIPQDTSWEKWLHQDVDVVFVVNETTLDLHNLAKQMNQDSVIIQGKVSHLLLQFFNEHSKTSYTENNNTELILNHIQDGLIVINKNKNISYINDSAKKLVNIKRTFKVSDSIYDIYPSKSFEAVLRSRRSEKYKRFEFKSGKHAVVSHIPLVNESNHLVGGLAIFKKMSQVIELAEKYTNLNEVNETLSILINTVQNGIHIVDESCQCVVMNDKFKDTFSQRHDYNKIERMHEDIVDTRRPIITTNLTLTQPQDKVGVSVYPIIINGKMKGSIAITEGLSTVDKLTKELICKKQIIRQLESTYNFSDIIGQSPRLKIAIDQAKLAANSSSPLLLRGEIGTEKALFARAIHQESKRKHYKFVRFNCMYKSSLELTTLLFGSEKEERKEKGVLERADQGTVLLENIEYTPKELQDKLLHYLKTGKIKREGSHHSINLTTRIIATTSISLEEIAVNKKLSQQLYYRLNQLTIYIPPLRKRGRDISLLISHLLKQLNKKYDKNLQSIDDDALRELESYDWSLNISELELILSQIVMSIDPSETNIRPIHLPPSVFKSNSSENAFIPKDNDSTYLQQAMDNYEKEFIKQVYRSYKYNKTNTAKALNISLRNLYYKISKYELD